MDATGAPSRVGREKRPPSEALVSDKREAVLSCGGGRSVAMMLCGALYSAAAAASNDATSAHRRWLQCWDFPLLLLQLLLLLLQLLAAVRLCLRKWGQLLCL